MKYSIKKGLGFGVTSGVITTLGLIVGLYSGTHSKFVVLGGILMIAIADAMSDALGMHISEESTNKNHIEVWESTASTFIFKFLFASIFILPFLFLELQRAIEICIILGLAILGTFSYIIAKQQKTSTIRVVLEHVIIAIIVIIITYYVGVFVNRLV